MESFLGRSQDVFAMQEHRKKRLKIILIRLAGILATAGLLVLIFNLWINRKYNTYEVLQSTESSVGSGVYYAAYQDKVLKCSKNGISALDASGQIAWNGSFDMTSPAVDIAGQYVVVADIGNKNFMYIMVRIVVRNL